jgi:hypothetical protein
MMISGRRCLRIRFVGSQDRSVSGRNAVLAPDVIFRIFPDCGIEAESIFTSGGTLAIFGHASGIPKLRYDASRMDSDVIGEKKKVGRSMPIGVKVIEGGWVDGRGVQAARGT